MLGVVLAPSDVTRKLECLHFLLFYSYIPCGVDNLGEFAFEVSPSYPVFFVLCCCFSFSFLRYDTRFLGARLYIYVFFYKLFFLHSSFSYIFHFYHNHCYLLFRILLLLSFFTCLFDFSSHDIFILFPPSGIFFLIALSYHHFYRQVCFLPFPLPYLTLPCLHTNPSL